MKYGITYILMLLLMTSCHGYERAFIWNGSSTYFLLVDRFCNADSTNDVNFNRTEPTAILRGFKGGDFKGVIKQLENGYFEKLGINVIRMNPIVEQIHGSVDMGGGNTYGYQGYWTKDWSQIDPNFGTSNDLKHLVDLAHKKGIRVILDAVINYTGPITAQDPAWPTDWIKNENKLPTIRTESNTPVTLPQTLVLKWKKERRYEQQIKELDHFFSKTGYPRAPRYYIMKWLSDYVREYGIDGYRIDIQGSVQSSVLTDFKQVCQTAFDTWKKHHSSEVLDHNNFIILEDAPPLHISHLGGYEMATQLLLSPKPVQIFYGDETNRPLTIPGTRGDATLQSTMNWEDIKSDKTTEELLNYWQKLGKFRYDHPSIGAGVHHIITKSPYTFSCTLDDKEYKDQVVIALLKIPGDYSISVGKIFNDGTMIKDAFSGQMLEVHLGSVILRTPNKIVLLERLTEI